MNLHLESVSEIKADSSHKIKKIILKINLMYILNGKIGNKLLKKNETNCGNRIILNR